MTERLCNCGDRAANLCPGEWEPGCDLGNNENHAIIASPLTEKEMKMFDFIGDIAKAAVAVVKLPVDVAADVVTLGGSLTDRERPYTADGISDVVKNLENATEPRKTK